MGQRRQGRPISCTFCRARKLRCSRQFPCSNCTQRGVHCWRDEPCSAPTPVSSTDPTEAQHQTAERDPESVSNSELLSRLQKLEALVASQATELHKPRKRSSSARNSPELPPKVIRLAADAQELRRTSWDDTRSKVGSVPEPHRHFLLKNVSAGTPHF